MAIRLKLARTAQELDDVFRLRYDVYVAERGKFATDPRNPRIVDHFDAVPDTANVVAYDGDLAIAAMRINKDTPIGLPAESYFDFSEIRERLRQEYLERGEPLNIVGGSMLAIRREYRNRRNVIFALFKEAAGLMYSWGATHVIGSVRADTLSLYHRIGFEAMAEPAFNEVIGDHLLPILAPFDKVFEWTFGNISTQASHFWLDKFTPEFERILLAPGEVLFRQNDVAEHAYAVDEGWISISRTDPGGNEMVLANLSRGAFFGEVAIFDGERRSATATALVNTELICIDRQRLLEAVRRNPEKMDQLLEHFARRIRQTDDLAMVLAFAPQTKRVEMALHELWQSSVPDRKKEGVRVARVGPAQIAKKARVREDEVRRVLEIRKAEGCLNYGEKVIRFFREPRAENRGEAGELGEAPAP